MADWLLIRLARKAAAPASWLVTDGAGRIVFREQHGALPEAAGLAPGRRVCALVPAGDVVLTEADVPVKSGIKAQQVVPFALEEQLATDVESLHFALGRRAVDSARMPVAVISRALLEGWLAELAAAGLKPEAVFAESELAPINPGQAVAVLEGDDAIVRPPGALPVTMPIDALADALHLARPAGEAVIAAEPPGGGGLVLYTGPAEWHQHQRIVESLRDRFDGIKVQLLTEGPLPLYAQRLAAAVSGEAINLQQGAYAPASSLGSGWRVWRVAAILLVALVALHAAGSATALMSLTRAERAVNVAIEQTFRAAMPGEHNAIDAQRRMAKRLASLRGGDSSGLLAALGALAEARAGAGDTAIRALQFRGGALELVLAAPNAESLDRLSQNLRACDTAIERKERVEQHEHGEPPGRGDQAPLALVERLKPGY
ncbi:MAG TPA: type II secretion system protein GspL [Steroidobacteraceae bacterium]